MWLPVPLGCGILLYFNLKSEPSPYVGGTALAVVGLVAAAFHRNRVFLYGWLVVFLVVLGFTAAQVRTWYVQAPMLYKKTYPLVLEGTVAYTDPLPRSYRVVLKDITVTEGDIRQTELPKLVRVKLKPNDTAEPVGGDVVSVRAVLQPISAPVLPGAFDFQRFAFFEQLGATGYALGDLTIIKPHVEGFVFDRLRRYIREHIEASVPDKEDAALITAFMVGDSNGISQQTWDICRKSGIAHLIAISGSHFVMIGGWPFFLIRALLAAIPFIALRWPIKKIAAAFAIATSVFYMMLIGSPIPAQRAVLSVSAVMVAIMLDRDPFTLRLASFSALAILLFEPESLLGASFELSYAAVICLIAFYEMTRGWWQERFRDENLVRRYGSYLLACVVTTGVASLATGPFALYHFARMPLLAGLVANMIAVPLSSILTFPVGLFACLMMPFGLEKWPLWVTQKSLDLILAVAKVTADWEYGSWRGGAVPAWFLAPIAIGGLWICFWRGRMRAFGVIPLAIAAGLLCFVQKPDVLAADFGDLFAVRSADGKLLFSSDRRGKFVRNEWLQLEGASDDYDVWPGEGQAGGLMTCDATSCEYKTKGQSISFVLAPEGLTAACTRSVLVFSHLDLGGETCAAPLKDKWKLYHSGAEAVYMKPEGLRVVSVTDERGSRPWTLPKRSWQNND